MIHKIKIRHRFVALAVLPMILLAAYGLREVRREWEHPDLDSPAFPS